MIASNVVVCLMTVATNLAPVEAFVPGPGNACYSQGRTETLYRLTCTTNYQHLADFGHDVIDNMPSGDIPGAARARTWIKYCTCPCHGGAVLHRQQRELEAETLHRIVESNLREDDE